MSNDSVKQTIDNGVSLVIPGRNCAKTIEQCLTSVVPMLGNSALQEIIFVDDGSTDATPTIAQRFPVRVIPGGGRGPGAARNLGWRAAQYALVWFVDSDCVAEPDALEQLLAQFDDPVVGGVSGSYGIMNPESLLASLIHEEIIERHRSMPFRVNFLATFNVVYRREVLEKVNGLDERYLKAQDAELSFRVMDAGYELRFVSTSRVKHFHQTRWRSYLRTQRQQGYWRVWLHMSHRGHAVGDSYSSAVDHLQPPLAMVCLMSLPLAAFESARWIPLIPFVLLVLAQVPLTVKLLARLGQPKYGLFAIMSLVRAFWRGVGMVHGLIGYCFSPKRRQTTVATEH